MRAPTISKSTKLKGLHDTLECYEKSMKLCLFNDVGYTIADRRAKAVKKEIKEIEEKP